MYGFVQLLRAANHANYAQAVPQHLVMLAVEDVASAEYKRFVTMFLDTSLGAFTQHEFTAKLHGI